MSGEDENATITGYHGDLRPHNILVRPDTFVLADFGLAKMEEHNSNSSSYKGGGGDFVAPESFTRGTQIAGSADIWSFGGILVEIASYMTGGPAARSSAQEQRMTHDGRFAGVDIDVSYFFVVRDKEFMVNPAVSSEIEKLQKSADDPMIAALLMLSKKNA